MRVLALDWGGKRIGVAVSDSTGIIAQPLETIANAAPASEAHLDRIAALVDEYEVKTIVLGLPIHMNGSSGPEVETVRGFGLEVERRTGIDVQFVDERWTSVEAERALRGTSRRKSRERRDAVAASLILRTWLERAKLP